ncbi:OmpA family protein [Candidatus Binatus sp.]|uniref:OmpA family protein n=1 Tax=Candidatus Binatus sp. TaxID=2811406 RepID=UPI00272D3E45|nr:OmpA family protein [Candidatus Binatus sp.]
MQTAQVGNAPEAGIAAHPDEKIRLEGLRFKADGASLRPNSKPVLDAAVEILKSEPNKKVYVDAYCEPSGGKEANLRLSQKRAENVKAYLETQGIASDRLIPRGFGAENFVASNDSPQTRKQNRRIELIPFTN